MTQTCAQTLWLLQEKTSSRLAHPQDQARFAKLGVVASMAPVHCTADVDRYIREWIGESVRCTLFLGRG